MMTFELCKNCGYGHTYGICWSCNSVSCGSRGGGDCVCILWVEGGGGAGGGDCVHILSAHLLSLVSLSSDESFEVEFMSPGSILMLRQLITRYGIGLFFTCVQVEGGVREGGEGEGGREWRGRGGWRGGWCKGGGEGGGRGGGGGGGGVLSHSSEIT